MAGAADATAGHWPASRWLHVRAPRIAQGLGLLALAGHAALWGFEAPWGRSVPGGAALLAAGLGWVLWAAWLFRRADTAIRPTDAPRILVDEGPYRFGRNPMYLGMTVAMLGIGLALGSPFMAAAAIAFAAVVHRVHIPFEEAQLQRAFGGWYIDYAATVRRWL
jgi:protein-S-isoprenylcysteine O-methyltransferase Ste14